MKNLINLDVEDFRIENLHTITQTHLYNKYLTKELGMCCYPHRGCNRFVGHRIGLRNWKEYRKTQYRIKDNDNS